MQQLIVFILFVLSFSLAQSLTGNYVFTDPDSKQSITLNLEQRPDNTFSGNLGFLGANLELTGQVTEPGTGTGEFTPINGEMNTLGVIVVTVKGDQLSLTFKDTGEALTLTREGATPLLADTTSGEDTIVTDGDDTIVTDEGDTIIGADENDIFIDEDEVAYCTDFLADAEAVAEDPDEETYCNDVLKTSTSTPTETQTTTPATNPLNSGGAQNPLTATSDAFSGVYRGENMGLSLQFADGQYTGTLDFNGQNYPVQGAAQENKLLATFQANGSPFEFVFYPQDTFFTLESGGQKYNLMKQP